MNSFDNRGFVVVFVGFGDCFARGLWIVCTPSIILFLFDEESMLLEMGTAVFSLE